MWKNLTMKLNQTFKNKITYYILIFIVFIIASFLIGYNRGVTNTRLEAQEFGYGEYVAVEGTTKTEWKWYN